MTASGQRTPLAPPLTRVLCIVYYTPFQIISTRDSQFPVACSDLYWCDFLCGEACDAGEGGLCFLTKLSRLRDTCAAVSRRVVSLGGDPALLEDHTLGAHHDDAFLEHFQHPGKHDGGCGAHALCEHCSGDCVRQDVHDYFFSLLGEAVDTPAIAPPANVKYALGDAVGTCDHFSLLSEDALQFVGTPVEGYGGSGSGRRRTGSTRSAGGTGSLWASSLVKVAVPVVVLLLLALAGALAAKLAGETGFAGFLKRRGWGRPSSLAGDPRYAAVPTDPSAAASNSKANDPTLGLDVWRAQNPAREAQRSLLRHTHVYGAFVNQNYSDDDDAASECGSDVVVL
jgi:hypothetical protein